MARDFAYLLPLLLLACDPGPASTSDTEGDDGSSTSSADTTAPSTTSGDDPTGETSANADTSSGPDDPTGDNPTGDDPTGDDPTGGDTTGEPTESDTDGTSSSSTGDPPMAVCGDGQIEGDEVCDDGEANGEYGQCAADCQGAGPHCGDGNTDAEFEQCDDGDAINGNGCNIDCVVSASTLWEVTKTTIGSTSFDIGREVVQMGDGTLRVASQGNVNATTQHVLLTDFDIDGAELDEHLHINATYPTPHFDVAGLHPDGTYNLIRFNVGQMFNGYNVSARSADHMFNDWIRDMDDGFTAVRRTGGGGLYVQQENPGDPATYYIVDADGDTVYFSPANTALRYHSIAEVGSDVALIEEADVGAGFQPTLARFEEDGSLVYRTFYDSAYEGVDGRWDDAIIGIGPDQSVAVAVPLGGSTNAAMVLAKFSADGALEWETYLEDDDAGLHPEHVTVDGAGAVILGGRRQPSLIDNDGLIIKLDPDGAQLWTHDLVGSGHEAVFDVTVLADDSLVAVGAYTQISGSTDIWVSRIAP